MNQLCQWNVIGTGDDARRQCEWHIQYNDAMAKLNSACTLTNPCEILPFTCLTLPPNPPTGTTVVCSDCQPDAACSCGGSGALAVFNGTDWDCNVLGGGGGGNCPTGNVREVQFNAGAACGTDPDFRYRTDIDGTDEGLQVGSDGVDTCPGAPTGVVLNRDFGQIIASGNIYGSYIESQGNIYWDNQSCVDTFQVGTLGWTAAGSGVSDNGYVELFNSVSGESTRIDKMDGGKIALIHDALGLYRTDTPPTCGFNQTGVEYEDLSSNLRCRCNGTQWCRIDDLTRCGNSANCDAAAGTTTTTTVTTTTNTTTTTGVATGTFQICKFIQSPSSGDDNKEYWAAPYGSLGVSGTRLEATGCHCNGVCSTAATFGWEKATGSGAGNSIDLQGGGSLSCQTGSNNITFTNFEPTDTDRDLILGQVVRYDVTNTPTSADEILLCLRFSLF